MTKTILEWVAIIGFSIGFSLLLHFGPKTISDNSTSAAVIAIGLIHITSSEVVSKGYNLNPINRTITIMTPKKTRIVGVLLIIIALFSEILA